MEEDLLEKLMNASQDIIPGEEEKGTDLLERLRIASLEEVPTEVPEPRDLTKLPFEPEPSLLDRIKSMAARMTAFIPKPEEKERPRIEVPEFPVEPGIRAATPAEKEFAEVHGNLYAMATQPERAKTETIQGEGWSRDPKFNYWSEKIAERAPMWLTAFAGAPSIIAIFELLTQAKNATHSLLEKSKYDPLAHRQLSEMIPKDAPSWLKTGATLGEGAADMIIAALASKKISKPLWEKNIKKIMEGMDKAGWFDELARASGKGTAADWNKFYQDLIKKVGGPESIEAELQRFLKIRKGVPAPPSRRIPGVEYKWPERPTARALPGREPFDLPVTERVKLPPAAPKLERPAKMIATEEGVVYEPGAPEAEILTERYRAAERGMPETEVVIDVTPKPEGGQTITIKSPERPVEPRTTVEASPVSPEKVVKPRAAPEYKQDPILAAVAEIGGIKADVDYKHSELKRLLPPNLIRSAKGEAGWFMDEAAQEISTIHPELGIEDAESLWEALERRRYAEKRIPTEKEEVTGEAAYAAQQAREFKEKEQQLAGILYENEWINEKTSMLYTDEVRADLESVLDQRLDPGQVIKREGRKYEYSFGLNEDGDTLFVGRYKLPEPEQVKLEIEPTKEEMFEMPSGDKIPKAIMSKLSTGKILKDQELKILEDNGLLTEKIKETQKQIKELTKKAKTRVPEFGEARPEQRGIDFEESGKLDLLAEEPPERGLPWRETEELISGHRGPYTKEQEAAWRSDIKEELSKWRAVNKETGHDMSLDAALKRELFNIDSYIGQPVKATVETFRGHLIESVPYKKGEKPPVMPKKGEELTPKQKAALGEKPVPAAEVEEKIPERIKMVKISIEDPNGEMFDLGNAPVDKLKEIRSYASSKGLSGKLKVGQPFTGKWKEHYSPSEHVTFIKEIIRDVKEVPAEEWKKWELYSGYPMTKEIKRAIDAIRSRHKEKKKIELNDLKEELQKTDEGKVQWMYLETERQLKAKKKATFRKAFRAAKRATVDTSGNIKKDLLSKMGDLGKEAVIHHDLIAGASSKGDRLYTKAEEKIYKNLNEKKLIRFFKGLSKDEEALLNWAIQSRRTVEISKYRKTLTPEKEKGYWEDLELTAEDEKFIRHPMGLTEEQHENWLKKEIPEKINRRADLYFEEMRKILNDYLEEGLISEKEHDFMSSKGVYSPRRFIQYIDPEEQFRVGGKTITVPSSGLKALDEGSYQVMETDSRLLLSSAISRAQSRIFRNRANKAAYLISEELPDNGIFIKSDPKKKTPGGYTKIKAMVDGEPKEMIMPDEYAIEWIHRDPLINEKLANAIGWFTGTKILKAMATGLNPEFALTNFPRDIAHIYLVTQEYSSFLPMFTLQFARDLLPTLKDAWLRGKRWQDYLDEGGGMIFLTHQGRPFKTTRRVLKIAQDVFGYIGESSEIWTRLALRERALRNGLDPYEATWVARNYLDFGQGGNVIKALDAGFPYLGAGVQGTRGIFRAIADHPVKTMWKFAQLAALAMGLYLANRSCNKECYDSVSDRDKINNFIITTPWMVKDKNGNERHFYFKIAKDQGQRVLSTVFENMMAKFLGEEIDGPQIAKSVQDFLPIIPSQNLPPALDAFMGYVANIDFWTNQAIWKGAKVKPREEYTIYTHPALAEAGKITGLSPERLEYSLSQFFTRGNIYTSLVSGGFSLALRDMDKADRRKVTAEVVQNIPFIRRVFKLTPPYKEKELKELEKAKEEEATRRHVQKRDLSEMANTYYRKLKDEKVKDRPLLGKIKAFIKAQPKEDRQRLSRWFSNYGIVYDIPERSWWLNLVDMPPEARAYVYINKFMTEDSEGQREMNKLAKKIPGLWSPRFVRRFKLLRKKWNQ